MSTKQNILKYIDIDGPVMDGADPDVEKRSKSSHDQSQWLKWSRIDCLMLHTGDERALHPNFDAPSSERTESVFDSIFSIPQ
jgi:hypothetical protein